MVLVGCGAVTQLYYAKAFAELQRNGVVNLVGIFDPDAGAVSATRTQLPWTIAANRFDELLELGAEIAVVASPPCFHADQCLKFLHAGLHVFCEKPLATNLEDADRIIATAKEMRLSAAIGLVRRHFPATRSIKAMLESGLIGRLRSVSCFEGGAFDWPVTSSQYFSAAQSGGGVLQDIGTHCLDLLTWWLGPPDGLEYFDDSMGGIEANCTVRLRYPHFEVNVRMSRDWTRPNLYRFEGERGWISWTVNDTNEVEVGLTEAAANGMLKLTSSTDRRQNFVDCFTSQISSFVSAIQAGVPPPVPAEAGRDVLSLIGACYESRRLMDMPWLSREESNRAVELGNHSG
jgi:myo-inositol 2-dehydrogenase / D-chiro-inositol 1-dehydrogenase